MLSVFHHFSTVFVLVALGEIIIQTVIQTLIYGNLYSYSEYIVGSNFSGTISMNNRFCGRRCFCFFPLLSEAYKYIRRHRHRKEIELFY